MKHLAALVSAALVATMLSLGFATAAHAECDNYGPCIDTRLSTWAKKNPIRAKQSVPFAVRLKADDGRYPKAKLTITVKRKSNGKVVYTGTRKYNDPVENYRTGKLPKGKFWVIVDAHTRNDRYEDDRDRFGVRVKR